MRISPRFRRARHVRAKTAPALAAGDKPWQRFLACLHPQRPRKAAIAARAARRGWRLRGPTSVAGEPGKASGFARPRCPAPVSGAGPEVWLHNPVMPNIAQILKSEISRVARKEIRSETLALKKAVTGYRTEIAALKRRTQALERQLQQLRKGAAKTAPPSDAEATRRQAAVQREGPGFAARPARARRRSSADCWWVRRRSRSTTGSRASRVRWRVTCRRSRRSGRWASARSPRALRPCEADSARRRLGGRRGPCPAARQRASAPGSA